MILQSTDSHTLSLDTHDSSNIFSQSWNVSRVLVLQPKPQGFDLDWLNS